MSQGWFTQSSDFVILRKNKDTRQHILKTDTHVLNFCLKIGALLCEGGQKSYKQHRRSSFLKKMMKEILKGGVRQKGKKGSRNDHKV